jgi:hypothetical protein
MTQDEIIEMARFAGITIDSFGFQGGFIEEFVVFAKLVEEKATEEANARANASWTLMCKKMVAFEREACAKVCEGRIQEGLDFEGCSKAIRARGEQA